MKNRNFLWVVRRREGLDSWLTRHLSIAPFRKSKILRYLREVMALHFEEKKNRNIIEDECFQTERIRYRIGSLVIQVEMRQRWGCKEIHLIGFAPNLNNCRKRDEGSLSKYSLTGWTTSSHTRMNFVKK
jgi:hypothetical protein